MLAGRVGMATASAGGSGSRIASVPGARVGDLSLSAKLLVRISGLDIGGDSRDRLCMVANSPVNDILHHFSKNELGRSCYSHFHRLVRWQMLDAHHIEE